MGWGMNSGGGGSGRNGGASSSAGGWGPSVGMNDGGFMSAEGNNFGGWTGGLDRGLSSSMGGGGGVSGRGMTAQQERGLLSTGIGGLFFSNPQEVSRHYQQQNYAARQKRIREKALAKYNAQYDDRLSLAKKTAEGELSPFGRIQATKALNRGDLTELEGYLGAPSAMRSTHTIGGLFGDMFNITGDDVQTTYEDRAELQAGGHLDKEGNKTGWGPVDPTGFLASIGAPGAAKAIGLGTYDLTGSIPAAKAAYQTTNMGLNSIGKTRQPSYFTEVAKPYVTSAIPGRGKAYNMATTALASAPTMALSAITGAPVGLLGQALQGMSTAARLNSYGITAGPNAPTPATRNDSNSYWRYVGGLLT